MSGLRRTCPAELRVRREMSVIIGPHDRPEPDVVVIRAEADNGPGQTFYPAADVVLAVEVVSADSENRDRKRKPLLYGEAGFRHFWRAEDDGAGHIILHVFELDVATRLYAMTGIFHDRITVNVPYKIDIDLTEIDQL